MRRRHARFTMAAVVALGVAGGAVHAATSSSAIVLGSGVPTSLPVVALDHMVPGEREAATYVIGLAGDAPASRVTLGIDGLVEGSPADGQLPLADVLRIDARVTAPGTTADCGDTDAATPLVQAMTVRQLASREPSDAVALRFEPGERACLEVGVDLPASADNRVQSQQVDFMLQVSATEILDGDPATSTDPQRPATPDTPESADEPDSPGEPDGGVGGVSTEQPMTPDRPDEGAPKPEQSPGPARPDGPTTNNSTDSVVDAAPAPSSPRQVAVTGMAVLRLAVAAGAALLLGAALTVFGRRRSR